VFFCVKKIHNLHGAREMQVGQIPNPFGAVADYGDFFGVPQTATQRFRIKPSAEIVGLFY
jgi:hypothetical protein